MTSFEKQRRRLAALSVAAGLTIVAVAPEAHAQAPQRSVADVAQARELFVKAKELRDAGDVKNALEKFKVAYALAVTPVIGLELGRTYRMAGQLVEARETFLAVARLATTAEETTRSADARREAAELAEQLAKSIPSVTIVVTGMPGDTVVVTVDGATVPSVALAAPRLMNPGPHIIVATAGSARDEARIELREGESKKVELKSAPQVAAAPPAARPSAEAAPAPPPPAEAPPPSSTPKVLMGVGFGLGGVGLLVGAITGGLALSKASSVKAACQGLVCPKSIDGDLSSGRTMGTVSTAMFVVGGAGVALGVVGAVLSKKQSPPSSDARGVRPWIGVGSAGLSGAF